MGNTQDFLAFASIVDKAHAEHGLYLTAVDGVDFLFAMRTDRCLVGSFLNLNDDIRFGLGH